MAKQSRQRAAGLSLLLALLLAACTTFLPTATPLPPTETPAPSPTPSATIIWFPPTATPTQRALPSPQPTPNLRPALTDVLLQDDFSQADLWQTSRRAAGVVAVSNQSINLGVQSEFGALQSLRQGKLPAHFYAEITINFNLCGPQDQAGLLFNALDDGNAYRALVRCDGQLRVERVRDFNYGIITNWAPGIGFLAGALQKVRLGVWQSGNEVRIFVNDTYQFSTQLPTAGSGQLGVFARAGGRDPVTMTFSDLTVSGVDPAAVPTPTPLP